MAVFCFCLGLPGSRRSRRLLSSTSTPRRGSGRRPIKVASWSCSGELEPATRGPWGAQVAGGVVSFRTQATAPAEKRGWGDRPDLLGDQTAEPSSATAAAPSSQQLFPTSWGLPRAPHHTHYIIQYELVDLPSLCGNLCSCSPHTLSALLFPGSGVLSRHNQAHLHSAPSDVTSVACFPLAHTVCSPSPTSASTLSLPQIHPSSLSLDTRSWDLKSAHPLLTHQPVTVLAVPFSLCTWLAHTRPVA